MGRINSQQIESGKNNTFYAQNEERRIKLTNYISLISLISVIIYICYYLYIGSSVLRGPMLLLAYCLPLFLLPILLNRLKLHLAAKLFIASFNSLLTIYFCLYYFGQEPGGHVFLLIFGIIPIFIWSSKEVVFPIIFFTLNLLSFVYIEFLSFPFQPHLEFPQEYISLTRGFSILTSFLGATAAIIIFHQLAQKKEELLQRQNDKIEQQKSELLELNSELNKNIEELTAQQEELNLSNVVKGKIFSVIAHDLRSPFNSITGLLGVLLDEFNELSKDEIENYLKSVHNTSQSTLTLLENLLDWSRLQTNKLKINPEKIDLHLLSDRAVSLNKALLKNKDIKISNQIKEGICAQADKYMLSTVLRNIISNAIKFTPKNGEIKLTTEITTRNKIIISISDNGIGMTKAEINKLFDVENNFTKSGTEDEKGTGLGLLICKEFVENNGGEISVSSIPKKGSTFSFSVNQCN